METVTIGGRRYSDPDIISLARQTGELICPRFTVRAQARLLLKRLNSYPGVPTDPFERLKVVASLSRIKVQPMNMDEQKRESRDAVLYPTTSGWLALYNPNRPKGRILFTLAHEIIHTLFPNSITGARFRSITNPDSREANELERLCDLGAAELVMPIDEFQKQANGQYSLGDVHRLSGHFGTSFEATVFRLASAHPGFAVAGLLRYRRRVGEEKRFKRNMRQTALFEASASRQHTVDERKYRSQSHHISEGCEGRRDQYIIRWNKSFDSSSVVYQARQGIIATAIECLPNSHSKPGRIEAIIAPYQREDADENSGDVLFFWEQTQ